MSLISINGKTSDHDASVQRLSAGTLGDSHMIPASVGGSALGNVINPFDSRVSLGGTWTVQAGAAITSFLNYDAFSTTVGSTITVNFTGSSIAVIGANLQNGGRFDVYVDGALTSGIVNTTTMLGAGYYSSSGRSLNATDTTVTVSSTSNFTSTGTIQIDQEQITYTGTTSGTFTGCSRGANGTTATTHIGGATVSACASVVEVYSAYDQARVVLWRANNLSLGTHQLQLVLRSDTNGSSSGHQMTIDGFVLGGLVGASNLHTEIRYFQLSGFSTDGNGIANSILLTPDNTGSQLIGILGAYPVSGCVWCYPMWNPNTQTISLVTNAISSTVSAVLTCVFAGPTF